MSVQPFSKSQLGGGSSWLAERLSRVERPDRVAEVSARVQDSLIEALGPSLYNSTLTERELQEMVHERLKDLLEKEVVPLSPQEKAQIIRQIGDAVLGL